MVTVPAIVLITNSASVRYTIYQNILVHRLGNPQIVFIGDSITRGGGIWGWRIGEYNLNVSNYGSNGFTTWQMHILAKSAAAKEHTRFVFVMAGTNDPDKTMEGARKSFEDYRKLLEILIHAEITPVIQLTLHRKDGSAAEFINSLNQHLKQYAREHNITIIDLNQDLAPDGLLLEKYSLDGIHLTEAAYKIWATRVKQVLNEIQ